MPKATDTPAEEGSVRVPAADLAARLAGLDLDAGTLEMVMAALTADVCDQVETGTT